jgi:hypothetical protein
MMNPFFVLTNALGQTLPSKIILDAVVEVGAGFIETEYLGGGGFYWEFLTEGVTFNFSENTLTQVTIYMKPMDGYTAFSGVISSEFNSARLKAAFGEPTVSVARKEDNVFGFLRAYIAYHYEQHILRFEFDEDDTLAMMHLTLIRDDGKARVAPISKA